MLSFYIVVPWPAECIYMWSTLEFQSIELQKLFCKNFGESVGYLLNARIIIWLLIEWRCLLHDWVYVRWRTFCSTSMWAFAIHVLKCLALKEFTNNFWQTYWNIGRSRTSSIIWTVKKSCIHMKGIQYCEIPRVDNHDLEFFPFRCKWWRFSFTINLNTLAVILLDKEKEILISIHLLVAVAGETFVASPIYGIRWQIWTPVSPEFCITHNIVDPDIL